MRKFVYWVILIVIIAFILELGGYLGIKIMDRKYDYSGMIVLPEAVRPDWYGKPYTRLRDILMNKDDYHPRFYSSFNINYSNFPNYIDHGVVQNNEDGYRGPKIECRKGKKFRILFLGGSTTYGMVRYPDQTFPAQTGKLLNEEIKKYTNRWDSVEVINAGIIGDLLTDELHNYLYKYRYYKPDLVVVHSAGNDGNFDLKGDWITPDYANSRNFNFWQIERIIPAWCMHSRFVSFLAMFFYYRPHDVDLERASSVTDVETTVNWFPKALKESVKDGGLTFNPFYINFGTLIRQILNDSASVLVIPFALDPDPRFVKFYASQHNPFYENIEVYNKMMKDIAIKNNVGWVDYKYESVSPQYWFDPCHLLAEGEKQKARLITNEIEALLKKEQ